VFRFADTDIKLASKTLRPHEDALTRVLNDTMPGLVAGPSGDALQATLTGVGTDDRMLGADQHHRLLIRPDAFHVSVLFQPTLAFLDRITDVLPFGMESARTSSAVLDDFVLKSYLPQLEEKVSDLFHQAVSGMSFVTLTGMTPMIFCMRQVRKRFRLIRHPLAFLPSPWSR
jgi:exocyst complex component 4